MKNKLTKLWAFARFALRAANQRRIAAFNEAMDYRTALLKVLGLESTATDEQITAALGTVETETETETETMTALNTARAEIATLKGQLSTLQQQADTAGNTAKATRILAINSALNAAVKGGIIAPASLEAERVALESAADLGASIEALEKRQPVFNTMPLNLPRPGQPAAVPGKMADRIQAYNAAIAETAKTHQCSDADAEQRVKADPRFKALCDSLSQNEQQTK